MVWLLQNYEHFTLEDEVLVLIADLRQALQSQSAEVIMDNALLMAHHAMRHTTAQLVDVILYADLKFRSRFSYANERKVQHSELQAREASLQALEATLGSEELAQLEATLALTLPSIVSVSWDPAGSEHHLQACVRDIVVKLQRQREQVT